MRQRIVIGTVVAVAIIAAMGTAIYDSAITAVRQRSHSLSMGSGTGLPPKAAVSVGSPIKWRVLDSRPRLLKGDIGTIGALLNGSFSGDGSQELLLIQPSGSTIYGDQGSKGRAPLKSAEIALFAWDADGDHVCEVLEQPEDYRVAGSAMTPQLTTIIHKLDGTCLAPLQGVNSHRHLASPRDFDGDGVADIVVRTNTPGGKVLVYGTGPRLLATLPALDDVLFFLMGNADGEDKTEVIERKTGTMDYFAYGDGTGPLSLGTTPRESCLGCADIDDDGMDELILVYNIYSLKRKQPVPLQYPAAARPQDNIANPSIACGNFLPGEKKLLALRVSPLRFSHTGICLFRADGTCAYYEEMGEPVMGLSMLSTKGIDHMVIQFADRLVIYP